MAYPKPIEQKLKEGNPGRRPLPEPVAVIPGMMAVPEPPRGLQAAGKRFWSDTWSVGSAWLSPQLDYSTVELAARAFDEVTTYRKQAMREHTIKEPLFSPSGKLMGERIVPSPVVKLLRDAEKQLQQWLMILAIPPVSRARLGLVQVKTQSKLEELLAKQRSQAIDAEVVDDD